MKTATNTPENASTPAVPAVDLTRKGKVPALLAGIPAQPAGPTAPATSRQPIPEIRVTAENLHGEAPAAMYDDRERIAIALDTEQPTERVAEGVQGLLREAFESGRWQRHDTTEGTAPSLAEVAETAIRAAIRAELNALSTHPRITADRLQRVIDDESARHLARVGEHSLDKAYADERFASATRAMEDALELSADPKGMALALRTALNMLVREVGQ
ncbi:hypothetical protein [Streptomyces wuyuanensis]|uniref:hypothetical protein n=1 Tax=Streptomyces wuyuanensis TaxID=1196353 RepID=UPI0034459471